MRSGWRLFVSVRGLWRRQLRGDSAAAAAEVLGDAGVALGAAVGGRPEVVAAVDTQAGGLAVGAEVGSAEEGGGDRGGGQECQDGEEAGQSEEVSV